MLPSVTTLIRAPPSGGIGLDVRHGVGAPLFGSALRGIEASGVVFKRAFSSPRLGAHYYGFC
jgi:hypothetical protein